MTTPSISPWPDEDAGETFASRAAEAPRGGAEFAALIEAQRLLQDRLAGSVLPPDVSTRVREQLIALAELLADYQAAEVDRNDGWRPDLPGRGHPLLPPFVVEEETATQMRGRVTFTRFYLGGNGAAHGGAQPLLFDDLLGKVANHHHEGVARTAFLTVNYRRIARVGEQLRFEASIDKIDGRKRWGSARLFDAAGELVADAEALFIRLLPGQP